ncbi:uncharacterized protein PHACADRAFT_265982 [Phanerochaete carnosa HHB-10118-sp]|uniref:Uncharacterized protein n=1 Tax=Phanerochaete carnosa (strain HHB-10118-sp) TaxID=650164 RepID=K5VQS6_PHACS|nr:uncharacterized protein PHACADRAFT_265982 [Phanerochaete carnosa HHB-10118-sp]EKM48924.1 hypothetical protein PHACADRAFT_265982 [Phanerochaete carnosa HHB-10118-sp]
MSSATDVPSETHEQRKVSFVLPSVSSAKAKPARAKRTSKSQSKSKSKSKRASAEAKLQASKYLASLLNQESEREQARRREAGLEPLMELTIPDDFVYTPRIYAFEFDKEVRAALTKWIRKACCIPDEDDPEWSVILACALTVLPKATGIHRLDVEFAIREGPAPEGEPESLPVLAVFYAYEYRKMHRRPTQKQVDKLSKILANRQPKWYTDMYPFDS